VGPARPSPCGADGSEFTVRKAFAVPPSGPGRNLVQGPDGNFYGTTGGGSSGLGTLFRVSPDRYQLCRHQNLTDAEGSVSARILGPDGYFYGTGGGPSGTGAFVKIRPDGTVFTVLRDFSRHLHNRPDAGSDGVFYGTTGRRERPFQHDLPNQRGWYRLCRAQGPFVRRGF
jgi:uncharacterized repeat protein (TIGR03803 family)